ncbi:MAG: nucleotide pyrophosphohydrolase [Desulforhopalus sp.]
MKKLQREIADFVDKRNWSQFHSPKNLAMALTVETAELLEIFQWMTAKESYNLDPEILEHAEQEIGDVMIYLTTLAASLGLDPLTAAKKKIRINAVKYPPDKNKID